MRNETRKLDLVDAAMAAIQYGLIVVGTAAAAAVIGGVWFYFTCVL